MLQGFLTRKSNYEKTFCVTERAELFDVVTERDRKLSLTNL